PAGVAAWPDPRRPARAGSPATSPAQGGGVAVRQACVRSPVLVSGGFNGEDAAADDAAAVTHRVDSLAIHLSQHLARRCAGYHALPAGAMRCPRPMTAPISTSGTATPRMRWA